MARSDYRKGALKFPFVVIPKDILMSAEWHALAPRAKVLVFDLMAQYTGKNNGRLCPSWQAMQRCGWNHEGTLIAAKRALLECSFAVLTRKGHPPRTAEWVGLTWWKLDFDKSMDIDPRNFPFLSFMKVAPSDPNTGRAELLTETQSDLRKSQDRRQKAALRPTEIVVMPTPSRPQ